MELSSYYLDACVGSGPSEIGVGRCQGQLESHGRCQVCCVVVGQTVFLGQNGQSENFGWNLLGSVNGKGL